MKDFKELIQRNYLATRKRGCITYNTDASEFVDKLNEELHEIESRYFKEGEIDISEVIDIVSVGINCITHLGHDFITEFEKQATIKNEQRADKQERNNK